MSEHSDYVRPRVRRNTAEPQSHAGSAISSADRVLIRLPEISSAAQSRITPMPSPVAGSSQQPASLPKTEKPATSSPAHRVIVEPFHREPNGVTRVDAAHSMTPGPHATAPDWLDESEGGVIKLIRRRGLPLVITASIIIVAVIVVRGRLTRNQRAGGPTQNQAAAQQGPPMRPAAISNDTTQSAAATGSLGVQNGRPQSAVRPGWQHAPPCHSIDDPHHRSSDADRHSMEPSIGSQRSCRSHTHD